MITKEQLGALLKDLESSRIERTTSENNTDKFAQAVCAFANDLPNTGNPGYLVIGANDKTGDCAGLKVTDDLLKNLEKRRIKAQTFDAWPTTDATLEDVSTRLFGDYRSLVVAPEIIAENHRTIENQMPFGCWCFDVWHQPKILFSVCLCTIFTFSRN